MMILDVILVRKFLNLVDKAIYNFDMVKGAFDDAGAYQISWGN